MRDEPAESRALAPLWALSLGAVAGSCAALAAPIAGPGRLHLLVTIFGAALVLLALRRGREAPTALWLIAGFAAVFGQGLDSAAHRHELARIIDGESPVWIRARLVVTEGWAEGRWGWRTRVRVLEATHDHLEVPELSRCRLEIRGRVRPLDLPRPGVTVKGFVSIRGSPGAPLLVATSHRLIETTDEARPLPVVRGFLADHLMAAAETDVDRIRAAELASALALGRRDLLPPDRREGWRRSGFAHLLAVSGLHVGLVGGILWLAFSAGGSSPTGARLALLIALPTYAVLAGASPSAVRAALMAVIYIGARLLGRAMIPMAAVLLTAFLLLVADPSLITDVSFQLTVTLTAALVRWAPGLSSAIPLPRWMAIAIAVPVIAQLAAAPLVATHFATAIPGAAVANLLIPWLLAPVVVASVAAAALAPILPVAAGWLLDIVDLGSRAIWIAGTPARAAELVPPTIPTPLLICVAVFGLVSLLPGRRAGIGALSYVATIVAFVVWWLVIPPEPRTEVELLPVSHGLSLRISSRGDQLVMDGGGMRREAAEMMASTRTRHLVGVIASHGDEDHIAGLGTFLSASEVDTLILPAWLMRSREAVPLIRTARRRRVRVVPVVRGSRIDLGSAVLEVLWPPAVDLPKDENERSLVARLILDQGEVLLTADIGQTSENRLEASTDLGCTILIVPHHGSRYSASADFLDATAPRFALIPAGPKNLHQHPHPEVIERLDDRGIPYRMPIRDGRCGVRWEDGEWVLYPAEIGSEE